METSVIIFIIIILLGGYVFFQNNQSDSYQNYNNYSKLQSNSDEFSTSTKLHWAHMPITFTFSADCTNLVLNRNKKAFSEITNQTEGAITFKEINDSSADISFVCYKEIPREDIYLTSGEAQYWGEGNKINKAVINYYNVVEGRTMLGCFNFPDVEIHEILHTFGFQHKSGFNTIMREVQGNCLYKIDKDILDELKDTYSY